jgi:hypothetical protein
MNSTEVQNYWTKITSVLDTCGHFPCLYSPNNRVYNKHLYSIYIVLGIISNLFQIHRRIWEVICKSYTTLCKGLEDLLRGSGGVEGLWNQFFPDTEGWPYLFPEGPGKTMKTAVKQIYVNM